MRSQPHSFLFPPKPFLSDSRIPSHSLLSLLYESQCLKLQQRPPRVVQRLPQPFQLEMLSKRYFRINVNGHHYPRNSLQSSASAASLNRLRGSFFQCIYSILIDDAAHPVRLGPICENLPTYLPTSQLYANLPVHQSGELFLTPCKGQDLNLPL